MSVPSKLKMYFRAGLNAFIKEATSSKSFFQIQHIMTLSTESSLNELSRYKKNGSKLIVSSAKITML